MALIKCIYMYRVILKSIIIGCACENTESIKIDKNLVNVADDRGMTPLLRLTALRPDAKRIEDVLADVDTLKDAGADLNAQDHGKHFVQSLRSNRKSSSSFMNTMQWHHQSSFDETRLANKANNVFNSDNISL